MASYRKIHFEITRTKYYFAQEFFGLGYACRSVHLTIMAEQNIINTISIIADVKTLWIHDSD